MYINLLQNNKFISVRLAPNNEKTKNEFCLYLLQE